MLTLHHDIETGSKRLIIRNPFAKAWIGHYPRLTDNLRHVKEVHNWRLYVQRAPHLPPRVGKSPTSLLVESRLRAWLLQRFRRRLRDLSFEDLCRIAQAQAKHPVRGRV